MYLFLCKIDFCDLPETKRKKIMYVKKKKNLHQNWIFQFHLNMAERYLRKFIYFEQNIFTGLKALHHFYITHLKNYNSRSVIFYDLWDNWPEYTHVSWNIRIKELKLLNKAISHIYVFFLVFHVKFLATREYLSCQIYDKIYFRAPD